MIMQYKFVRVPVVHQPGGPATALLEQKVHELAREGWRLVQVLVEIPAAVPTEYVVIVEREGEGEG